MGVLEGSVQFGPLTPVIIKGEPTPETPPELFEGRFVQVFSTPAEILLFEASITPEGAFRVELPPGEYLVGFTLVGIETAEGIPARITIAAGETVTLDISVDTGIR